MHFFRSWRVGRRGARGKWDGLAAKAGTIPHGCGRWCKSLAGPAREAARMQAAHRCTSIQTSAIARSFSTMSGNAQSKKEGIRPPALTATGSLPKGVMAPGERTPFPGAVRPWCWASKTGFPRHFLTLQAISPQRSDRRRCAGFVFWPDTDAVVYTGTYTGV